ncbi:MAG: DUF1963 domain-containing protein [Gammaproteobacteria bacterium]
MKFWKKLFGAQAQPETAAVYVDLASAKRDCYQPLVESGEAGSRLSKFSGSACIPVGEGWPECPNCENPMQLFLQLDGADLPQERSGSFGGGMLQMFYCTNSEPLCEVDCEAFFPFSRSSLVRVIDKTGADIQPSPVVDPFPAVSIVGWERFDDYPNWEELRAQGLELPDEQSDELAEAGFPRAGEKLFGWPAWIQGVEYPECPDCGARMNLLFQIDSENNLPYMFGDVGCGHITQCPTHPEQLAFGWACS